MKAQAGSHPALQAAGWLQTGLALPAELDGWSQVLHRQLLVLALCELVLLTLAWCEQVLMQLLPPAAEPCWPAQHSWHQLQCT